MEEHTAEQQKEQLRMKEFKRQKEEIRSERE